MVDQNKINHVDKILDMNEHFVKALHADVVDEAVSSYAEMYGGMDVSKMSNKRGIDKVSYYQSLSDDDRRIFKMFIRDVMVDTVSHVLGVLDGTTTLAEYEGEPTLLLDSVNTESELQDSYLRMIEEQNCESD